MPSANDLSTAPSGAATSRRERIQAAVVRAYHVYGTWLTGITWLRFAVLSILLLIFASLLRHVPPFSWTIGGYTEQVVRVHEKRKIIPPPKPTMPAPPAVPVAPADPAATAASSPSPVASAQASAPMGASVSDAPAADANKKDHVAIQIGENGIHINSKTTDGVDQQIHIDQNGVHIKGRGDTNNEIEVLNSDLADMQPDPADEAESSSTRYIEGAPLGRALPELAMLFIVASIMIKFTYKARIKAEAAAAAAVEVAETESLKRQVMEARMAAMQAQVEPHFLFNTLASIEHLIETDPPRAARMQRSLIEFLRQAMPTLREANATAVRDLGRELAVVKPYLEILRMRMDERLQTEVVVPDGLLSAKFPPMMLQCLVENAIRHGLEPKAEGGLLRITAQVVDGRLAVQVLDTGVGFGAAPTAGTGIGLNNIRERLQMLYAQQGRLDIDAPADGGTSATITIPYQVNGV